MSILLVLYLTAIALGLLQKKSKLVTVYIVAMMILLSGFRTTGADMNVYRTEYFYATISDNLAGTRYIGFFLFQKIFIGLGLNFDQFLFMTMALCTLLLYIGIRLMTTDVNFVLSCYLIYSFPMDAMQVRTMLALSFIIVAIGLLTRNTSVAKNTPARLGKYLIIGICCVVSSSMHSAFFICSAMIVLCMLVSHRDNYSNIVLLVTISALVVTRLGLIRDVLQFFANRGFLRDDASLIRQWSSLGTGLGWLIPSAICLLVVFAVVLTSNDSDNDQHSAIRAKALCITSIALIPFYMLDITYIRLLRPFMVVSYAVCSNGGSAVSASGSTKRELLSRIVLFLAIALLYIYEIAPSFPGTLGALLSSNIFL